MTVTFADRLKARAEETGNIICMGIDPVIEKIPVKKDTETAITEFFRNIIDAAISENTTPSIVKPNIAYFEQYGFEGLRALKATIGYAKGKNIPVLIDAKRGDIGKTSDAYAKSLFGFWQSDAITISPYMGTDSVTPFTEYEKKGKGIYILCRTSNPGAKDLQDLKIESAPLYMRTAQKITEWSNNQGVGAVVGATHPQELEQISGFFVSSEKQVPLLIPGVGSQGGSAKEVIQALKNTKNPLLLHRINSTSGIIYAYEKQGTDDYAGAAVKALKSISKEIKIH